jgi:hypothetical protein
MCSGRGGAEEKGKTGWNSVSHQIGGKTSLVPSYFVL